MEMGNGGTRHTETRAAGGTGFGTILLAAQPAQVRHATEFAAGLVGAFGATVQVLELPEPHGRRRAGRDHELAAAVAGQAEEIGADLIVLAADRVVVGRRHRSGSIRQQVTARTHLPVMVAPPPPGQGQVAARGRSAGTESMSPLRWAKRFQHV